MNTMQHFLGKFLLTFALICAAGIGIVQAKPTADGLPVIAAMELPKQAQETIALIKAGGPFPYSRDGIAFSNREKILPKQKRGYYKEYTVKTPGAKNRGARRIVTGGEGQFYYSDDHYASFKRVLEK
jgi:ribonuclease T1